MKNWLRLWLIFPLVLLITACSGGGGNGNADGTDNTLTPPAAPQNLQATATDTQVSLSWDAVANVDGYQVYWHDNGATTSEWTALPTTTSTNLNHTGLSTTVTYCYKVAAKIGDLEGSYTAEVDATTLPTMPENLSASASDTKVNLNWDTVTNADGYNIYWHDNGTTTSDWTLLQAVSLTSYAHTGLTNDISYSYQVTASFDTLESSPTIAASATPRSAPGAPALVRSAITHTAENDNPLTLSWPAVTDATLYRVYYSKNSTVGTSDAYVESTETSVTLSAANGNLSIQDGERYYMRIMPVNVDVTGSFSEQFIVAAQPKWMPISSGYGVSAINGMALDTTNGIYVHVGANGLISRSTDGQNWSLQHAGIGGYELTDVVWTGTRFVAIGTDNASSNAKAIVLSSSDGVDWQASHGVLAGSPRSIAWNGSELLTVGYKLAARSDDEGDTWTPITSMNGANVSTAYFTSVIWDGSQFVLAELGVVVTSSDLTNWAFFSTSQLIDIAFSGSAYVAVGPFGVFTSSDLSTWAETLAIPEGAPTYFYFTNVVWDSPNNQFIALGVDTSVNDSGKLYTSPDGTSWTESTTDLSRFIKGLFNDGTQTLLYGDKGVMLTSTNGTSWSALENHEGANLYGLTEVGANGWAASGSNATLGMSPDGNNWNWSTRTCSSWTTGSNWADIAYNGTNLFVAVGSEGCVITSSDGVSWVERSSGVSENLSSVIWDGTQFVAIGANGTLLTSTNGSPWTQQTLPVSANLSRLIYAAGTYVATGNSGTILTSTDATNWTQQTSPTSLNLRGLAYRNGNFIIGAPSGYVLTSDDAVNWTLTSVTSGGGSQMNTVCATDDGYMGITLNGEAFSSSDGTTWQQDSAPPMAAIYRCEINSSGRMLISGVGGLLMSQ
ncbi:fibronectin type III domain-containing protein [Reinekea sp. G2M2-21]|uniref:fibronectin type III domain-containing protein n=1 Tax=Reinekea sp. G2M2-21 TaxID=2788942 RepID=UPI0018A9C437|nr:fibronectin type III domain-containing protein [Reinekea sp. G2M2-21]